jgi:hypothetical protein
MIDSGEIMFLILKYRHFRVKYRDRPHLGEVGQRAQGLGARAGGGSLPSPPEQQFSIANKIHIII